MERGEQLYDACQQSQWEKAMELLDGCSERDVNWKNSRAQRTTPLMMVCWVGAPLDVLNKMEERGADINVVNVVSRRAGGCNAVPMHVY